MKKNQLTDKQHQFVIEYAKDWNATKAGLRAGYSDASYGRQLLAKPQVREAIEALQERARHGAVMTMDEMCQRLTRLARRDIQEFMNDHGVIEPSRGDTYVIHSVDQAVDGEANPVIKLRMVDPLKAMEQLAKLMGYNAPDRTENETTITIREPDGWGEGEYEEDDPSDGD